jgi:hypothetical protein
MKFAVLLAFLCVLTLTHAAFTVRVFSNRAPEIVVTSDDDQGAGELAEDCRVPVEHEPVITWNWDELDEETEQGHDEEDSRGFFFAF